ncbi:hypothetical protein [uncultured Treponema sp.]|uniref:hypothetical protein n=1 Tax=uncultured Treponema sp. TaxID=162155 RepID=UPI0025CCCFB0|nr:hypothetical protein [uncultured Treponema sp.]
MQTSVLDTYNQLTAQDQEKVTTFIYSLFSKYKKTSAKKTLSAEDEELFNHFTGSLSLESDDEVLKISDTLIKQNLEAYRELAK